MKKSSAFDTINHAILIACLKQWIGISGSALSWFNYTAGITCGVPQGSILGPILFYVYMLLLGHIIHKYNISFHSYADDTQLYLHIDIMIPTALLLSETDINCHMSQNCLQLNESKAELVPSEQSSNKKNLTWSTSRNDAEIFYSDLTFEEHVRSVVLSCFLQLRNVSNIKVVLSCADLKMEMHAFISSCPDYCNSLYTFFSQKSISCLA